MSTTQIGALAPLAAPLPPVPNGQALTPSQWTTLMAFADTIIPSIENVSDIAEGDSRVGEYYKESASSVPGFREALQRLFSDYVRPDALDGIKVILSALE